MMARLEQFTKIIASAIHGGVPAAQIAETAETVTLKKPAKELPDGVHPRSAYWYTKGSIDELNAGERMVLAADYKAWAKEKPDAAKTFDEKAYCIYRQDQHAKRVAKRFTQLKS